MKKVLGIICGIFIVVCAALIVFICINNNELKTVKSDKELIKFYEKDTYREMNVFERLLTLPFSMLMLSRNYDVYDQWNDIQTVDGGINDSESAVRKDSGSDTNTTGSTKDYSKTNIQVEGVDEADIIKTDGDYIYSISEKNVIITDAKDPNSLNKVATISFDNPPEDILLYKDQLIVINTENKNGVYDRYYWTYRSNDNTIVNIYNIKDKSNPKKIKSFKLNEDYKTSRLTDGNLYIFSSGYLRKDNDKVEREYEENNETKEINLKDIKYLKDKVSNQQTLIASVDLNNIDKNIQVSSYLVNMNNSYISKNSIYLIDSNYDSRNVTLKDLFTFKGIIGFIIDADRKAYDSGYKTTIYKFDIDKKQIQKLMEKLLINIQWMS